MTTSEEFAGRAGEMRDSEWMAKEDIVGLGDVVVEIEKVYKSRNVSFDQGRKKDLVYSIMFKGGAKRLIINSTNRKTLTKMYGVNVKDWAGKKIALYVDDNVKMKGVKVGGIRIREEKQS